MDENKDDFKFNQGKVRDRIAKSKMVLGEVLEVEVGI